MKRSRVRTGALAAMAAILLLGPAPSLFAIEGGGGAPPPPPPPADNRFFPKELEDALKELDDAAGDEETRYDALAKIARMRGLDGAEEPLKKDAFDPVLKRALGTRPDAFADGAGTFLAALDGDRLAAELKKAAEGEKEAARLRAMTFLAENLGLPRGAEILAGPLSSSSAKEVRVRVMEALGLLRAPQGVAIALAQMKEPDPEVRNVAAATLGRIGDPRAVAALLSGLSDNKGSHGWYCAEALGAIEDPAVFDAVLSRASSGGSKGTLAKAVEVCARAVHTDALVRMLQGSPTWEMRTAAANALGRLAGDGAEDVAPGTREAAAAALLDAMCADSQAPVRAASLFALRRCAVESTGPAALKRLTAVKGDDKVLYIITILGERKVADAAVQLLRNGIMAAKQTMIRRAAGVAFWQISEPGAVKEFKERLEAANGFDTIQRLCEALGSWRSKEGFDLALKMLRTTREGSREQMEVLLALEKMTGHWFGPYPGIWNKWYEQNPAFFTGKQSKIEREKWREEFDKENRGFRHTKETEKSVQMGLSWLARHQNFDGIWDTTGILNHCDAKNPCSRQGGGRTQFSQAGTTGMPLLAFTGAGYHPDFGKYRHTLRRGLDSLLATVGVEGDFDQGDLLWNRSYSRPIAMQALAEGYSTTGDERYRRAAERILAREFSLMNERGGWRYSLQREVPELDSSVTAWVVFAMKAADKAGIPVPRLLWEGPYLAFDFMSTRVPAQAEFYEQFLEVKDAGNYGTEVGEGTTYLFQTGYTDPSGGPGRATTPLGLMSRIFLGWKRTHPFCIGSANYVIKTYLPEFETFGEPGKEDWSRAGRFAPQAIWPMYNFYYCTLAMHQMGGRYFGQWNRRISRVLPFFQKKEGCERGSWDGRWGRDSAFGWLYTTSMGVLTLETYYRYAPILAD